MEYKQGFPHHGRVWVKKLVPPHRRPDVVLNEQGFSHLSGRVRVKKLVHESRIRIGSWNIGSLTGKSMELVDTLKRRRIDIVCLQETRWIGNKAREIGNTGYKLWYCGGDKHRNGVGIIVEPKMKDKVVEVKRIGDRIIHLKLVLGKETINIVSVYAPQVGLGEEDKVKFWEDLDGVVLGIPSEQELFIGGDLNGHVGRLSDGYEQVHGGYGYGNRNEEGKSILDFALAHDLVLTNTCFKKRESHLITFKNGGNCSQIDFLVTRRRDKSICKDCKVIPGEALTTQHRLVVLDVKKKGIVKTERRVKQNKIRWWALKGTNQLAFKDKIWEEGGTNEDDANTLWKEMANALLQK
ncbi:hypothetical protein J5N97_023012 [Dioscorea zingiberensis]|uniref:Endonuclease/exonuclease/phosphatase domain-containing protein n=1 Tax=Dioscorea zingiberensis TaxID=325984 RepID=A0A9D5CD30_9LILI|nr:hypothetical protein J5N97_023012 [Dioscorea zingiberensis]